MFVEQVGFHPSENGPDGWRERETRGVISAESRGSIPVPGGICHDPAGPVRFGLHIAFMVAGCS